MVQTGAMTVERTHSLGSQESTKPGNEQKGYSDGSFHALTMCIGDQACTINQTFAILHREPMHELVNSSRRYKESTQIC